MKARRRLWVITGTAVLGFAAPALGRGLDVRPDVTIELRGFAEDPQFDGQLGSAQLGLVLTAQGSWRSKNRKTRINIEPYVRLDNQDSRRSYGDIRELSVAHDFGVWDVVAGISQVFWGVAESRNVVDVINQIDAIEDVDEGEKLGQPMIRASRRFGRGNFELYYLPYFRERVFPGSAGRLRFAPAVDDNMIRYERGGDEWAGDWAVRYTQRSGSLDLGLHAFHGTSRNPFLALSPGGERLRQTYQALNQVGIDAQYTKEAWLWKTELVRAKVGGDQFTSAVAGFEFTFFGIGQSAYDIGLIGEYLHDTRDLVRTPITVLDNDVFVGARLTVNDTQDTELLAGIIVDHDSGASQFSTEFQRRIGNHVLVEIEARAFNGSNEPFIEAFESDDYVVVRWTRYF